MTTTASRRRQDVLRTALAFGVISLGLHASLLLAPQPGNPFNGTSQAGAPELRVTFIRPLEASDWNRATFEAPKLVAGVTRLPDYVKLLPFSPIDWHRSFDEAAYRPLHELSVPPATDQEIAIPFPQGVHHLGTLTAVLTLFIDQDGSVANVRVEEPRLADAYERAAIDAFSRVRFHPGEIGARAVKARMTIRVAFDSGDSGKTELAQIASSPRKP